MKIKNWRKFFIIKLSMNNICGFINCWDMYNIVGNKRVRGVVD